MSDWDLEIFNRVANPEPGWAITLTPGFELFDVNEQTFAKVISNDSSTTSITLKYNWPGREFRSYKYVESYCYPVGVRRNNEV